jgi:hypothetical protein
MIYIIIWFVGWIIVSIIDGVCGFTSKEEKENKEDGAVFFILLLKTFWPIALAACIFLCIFFFLYKLLQLPTRFVEKISFYVKNKLK